MRQCSNCFTICTQWSIPSYVLFKCVFLWSSALEKFSQCALHKSQCTGHFRNKQIEQCFFIELQPLANHELSNRPGDLESHQVKDKKPCCSKHLLSWPGGRNAMLARPILGFYKQRLMLRCHGI